MRTKRMEIEDVLRDLLRGRIHDVVDATDEILRIVDRAEFVDFGALGTLDAIRSARLTLEREK